MRDPRLDKWAEVLVDYSLATQPKHQVLLMGDIRAMPLVEACYEKLLKVGAFVDLYLTPSWQEEAFYDLANEAQLSRFSPNLKYAVEHCDRMLRIAASVNTKALSNVSLEKQRIASQARKPFLDIVLGRAAKDEMRWALTLFPTPAAAQDSEMGNREYEEFVFEAGLLNLDDPIAAWKKVEQQQQKLADFLEGKKELRFKNNEGTDLLVNIDGMKWVNCCGRINFPDGEVYTGPNLNAKDGGVNGIAKYSFPTVYRGVEVQGIELTFENGGVVDAKASKNESFLKEMIKQDEGARFIGEVAIGTNYFVQNGTKNILFDEKIGGTFHTALGKGYPQTGNNNMSALHWDLVCDLRRGGTIEADGETIAKDGRFTNQEWPQP